MAVDPQGPLTEPNFEDDGFEIVGVNIGPAQPAEPAAPLEGSAAVPSRKRRSSNATGDPSGVVKKEPCDTRLPVKTSTKKRKIDRDDQDLANLSHRSDDNDTDDNDDSPRFDEDDDVETKWSPRELREFESECTRRLGFIGLIHDEQPAHESRSGPSL